MPLDAAAPFLPEVPKFEKDAPSHAYGLDAIPTDGMILDVGPMSVDRINAAGAGVVDSGGFAAVSSSSVAARSSTRPRSFTPRSAAGPDPTARPG